MTPREQRFIDALAAVRDEKVKNRRIPTFTLETELSRHLTREDVATARETAEELKSRGLVRIGQTVNLTYYEILDPETSPEESGPDTEQQLFTN